MADFLKESISRLGDLLLLLKNLWQVQFFCLQETQTDKVTISSERNQLSQVNQWTDMHK